MQRNKLRADTQSNNNNRQRLSLDLITWAQPLFHHLIASADAVVWVSLWAQVEECLPFDLIHNIQGQDPRLSVECVHSVELHIKSSVLEAVLILSLARNVKMILVWYSFGQFVLFLCTFCCYLCIEKPLSYISKCFLKRINIKTLVERKVRFAFIGGERYWISCHCPHGKIFHCEMTWGVII